MHPDEDKESQGKKEEFNLRKHLHVLSGSPNGFTVWTLKLPADNRAVFEPGFFDPAAGLVQPGDVIYIVTSDNADTARTFAVYVDMAKSDRVTVQALTKLSPMG